MLLRNLTNNQVLSENVKVASHFTTRFLGLMGKSNLPSKDCLWITNCNSIHTCFMNFSIDVIFIDKDMKVVAIKEQITPWRFTWPVITAKSVIEFSSQKIGEIVKVGDQLHVGN